MKGIPGEYDAIVIGAGPGGLSAGISLARRGKRVLIAEKNGLPGGNCTAKKYGDYTFDLAVHQLSGIGPGGGICSAILREYGVAERVEFRRVDPFLVIDMPGRSYALRGSAEAFRDELARDFPEHRGDIDRMMRGLAGLKLDSMLIQRLLYGSNPVIDAMLAAEAGPARLLSFPFTFAWGIALRMKSCADDMLRRWVRDARLRSVVNASWVYLGLPPRRLSGVMMEVFVAMQHREHTYYPAGGSQRLADAMAEVFRENGGELLLSAPVARVLTERGRAAGVRLEDGREFRAPVVISNAAPLHTYGRLMEPADLPRGFLERLKKMRVSMAPFRVCLGLDYDVAAAGMPDHEYLIYDSADHEETWRAMRRGEPAVLSAYSPTRLSPDLAPPGHSTLILTTLLPWRPEKDWRGREEEIAAGMIARMEKERLPGLSRHIRMKEVLTPAGLEKLTNSTEGAMYGWANTPEQVLTFRLSPRSPVPGLYHAGQWTRPGTGVTTAILSGWMLGNRLERRAALAGRIMDRLL